MKNKGTWILFGVVVLLSLYTYFGEYQGKEKEKTKEEQQAVILKGINVDQINFVEVNNLDEKVTISRSNTGWQVTSPIADAADSNDIESWLKQLTDEKTISVAVEGAEIKWEYFGFNVPVKTLTVKTSLNQQLTVEVSEKKNFEGNSFLRLPGENKVMVGSSSWSSHAGKKLFDLRNKNIFRHQLSNVQSFQVKNKRNLIEIINKEAKWIAPKQPDLVLDQNVIRENIIKINELKAIEFIAEKEGVPAAKKKLGLGTSSVTIEFKLSEGTWVANVFEAKDKGAYVEVAGTQQLIKINNEIMDRLNNLSLVSLRDYKLPFASFDKAKVNGLSYVTTLKKAALTKKNGNWELNPADSANEVQQDKVTSLLDVVKNLTAKEYVNTASLKKDISKQKIVFTDAENKVYFEFQFSDPESRKVNNEESSIRYAKTNLHNEPFVMDESEFQKLSLNDIIGSKKEVKNDK
ncbi:MAG: DUF4340 domain-containing protein [Bdellovibrionaceae bacterium]|jgi:hypothetical protein|nr:DUF4340 domain-containing protein [Pseudobdellovibrionaceae bacterium]